jgi:hypothetical protein
MKIETFQDKYNIRSILRGGDVIRERRGKDIVHWVYVVLFKDGTDMEVEVPHYFETIGTERLFVKELEQNKLIKRNKKIQKIKQKTLCGAL